MNSISEILQDFKAGRFVILVDDENRENEGDIMIAADFINEKNINFLVNQARGLICLALSAQQVEKLQLPMMTSPLHQSCENQAAFTVSIEASSGVTTGVSAADRAHTIYKASRPEAVPGDVICPGHIFPLRAHPQGVLSRAGHTEASVDLAKLAGLNSASVICEMVNEDGTLARKEDLKKFSAKFGIKIGTIFDLIEYRRSNNL